MRILHTSDWHLGARLGNQDRLPDQLARVDETCGYIDEREVDLLLVAGDVFDEHRADALAKIIGRLGRLLAPRILAGLTCVFIAGNHDREHVFPLLRGLQTLVAADDRGRVIFAERPALEQVTSPRGEKLNLMLLPYPTPSRYDLADERWPSPDAKHDALHDEVRNRIQALVSQVKAVGAGVPTVTCAHFWIRGVTEGLYRVTEQNDIVIDPSDIPVYAYTALGHIHKPQYVGAPNIRYSGSIERMDRGEAKDKKKAVLVEVTRSGAQGVEELSLNATPFAHLQVSSEEELETAAAKVVEPDRTLVSVTADLRREQSLGSLIARARKLFPRLYGSVDVNWIDARSRDRPAFEADRLDVQATVRAYLSQVLQHDPNAQELTSAAEELLIQTGMSRA